MKKQENNHKRKTITEEGLLKYKGLISISDRNIEIVEGYATGATYKELSEKYSISVSRISGIVFNYIRLCHKYQKNIDI